MQQFQIGPGPLATPAVENGPKLALASPCLNTIQAYVARAVLLPKNTDEFRKLLNARGPASLATFEKLIAVWAEIATNAEVWRDKTFENIVRLASDIYQYGNQAAVYYKRVKEFAARLRKDLGDKEAKEGLAAAITKLENEAKVRSKKADAVMLEVQDFHKKLDKDKVALQGPNGNGGILAEYKQKIAPLLIETADLDTDIAATLHKSKETWAEYVHHATVASTTVSYAFVNVIGTLAAVIVAAVHGPKATAARREFEALQKRYSELDERKRAAIELKFALDLSVTDTCDVSDKLKNAVSAIEKVRGAWTSIAHDLGGIVTLIDTDIRQAALILIDDGVDLVVGEWQTLAQSADQFRQTAYVQPAAPQPVTMEMYEELAAQMWNADTLQHVEH